MSITLIEMFDQAIIDRDYAEEIIVTTSAKGVKMNKEDFETLIEMKRIFDNATLFLDFYKHFSVAYSDKVGELFSYYHNKAREVNC